MRFGLRCSNTELREFVVALRDDQARNTRNYTETLQDIATEVPKVSSSSSFKRNISELDTTSSKSKFKIYMVCPNTGFITGNGEIFI